MHAEQRGFYWCVAWPRGQGNRTNRGDLCSDRIGDGVMFVEVSLGGMTGGPALSAAEGERSVPFRGGEGNGPWAVSEPRPKCCRWPLFLF
jgi:hypothetical protein